MLEALISLRRDHDTQAVGTSETSIKCKGDILEVRKVGWAGSWGDQEKKRFLIALYKDDTLEASMSKDVLRNPFGKWETREEIEGHPKTEENILVNRSTYRVDLDHFTGSPGLDVDDTTSEPVAPEQGTENEGHLVKNDLIFDDSNRL